MYLQRLIQYLVAVTCRNCLMNTLNLSPHLSFSLFLFFSGCWLGHGSYKMDPFQLIAPISPLFLVFCIQLGKSCTVSTRRFSLAPLCFWSKPTGIHTWLRDLSGSSRPPALLWRPCRWSRWHASVCPLLRGHTGASHPHPVIPSSSLLRGGVRLHGARWVVTSRPWSWTECWIDGLIVVIKNK